jgi:hypothetical protein
MKPPRAAASAGAAGRPANLGGMSRSRPAVSTLPALVGLAVLVGGRAGTVVGLYAGLLGLAALIGICFRGYLRTLDGAGPRVVVETLACAAAAALLLASCALRFPDVIAGTVPSAAERLTETAFALTLAASLAPIALAPLRHAGSAVRRRVARRAADRRLAQRLRRPADVV